MAAQEILENKGIWEKLRLVVNKEIVECMQEYARIKCLEAIKNTRYKAIEIVQISIPNEINGPCSAIMNIPNEEVMPKFD